MIEILDFLGLLSFVISGALLAINKKLDPFGVFVIAFVTSVGGGTLRDVLIGQTPVGWMQDLTTVYVIIGGYFFTILFRNHLEKYRKSLFLFDTIGLGLFTITGIEIGQQYELHPIICVALGTISACFGGVIRDILCNEIPIIFRKEIYATVCIFGGIVFFLLNLTKIPHEIIQLLTALSIIIMRISAVKFKWNLSAFS